MTEQRSVALTLPDEQSFRRDIAAINKFQQIVHQTMVAGQDYGVIPGTGNKPTLLKPGAEKIVKLLGLSDQYEIMDKKEDWPTPFFRYLIKCRLVHIESGDVISEGLGECNSMESKYRWRWLGERDLPPGTDKSKLVSQERRSKAGGHWQVYRLENEDIYSQVNTILKMAKKRALVDAALSAGRLSNIFTQDIEDTTSVETEDVPSETIKRREDLVEKVMYSAYRPDTTKSSQEKQETQEKPKAVESVGEDDKATDKDLLIGLVIHWLKLRGNKAANSALDWLTNVANIPKDRIDAEPKNVANELIEKYNWK